jgi:hypothetical protein
MENTPRKTALGSQPRGRAKATPPTVSVGEIKRLEARYRSLVEGLGKLGLISQGSVMFEPPGAWRWTRKESGKTVSVALSAEQAEQMQQAIRNHRILEKTVIELRQIAQKILLKKTAKKPNSGNDEKHPNPALT